MAKPPRITPKMPKPAPKGAVKPAPKPMPLVKPRTKAAPPAASAINRANRAQAPGLVQISPKEFRRREVGETVADVQKRAAQETAKIAADRARGARNLQAQRALDRMVGAGVRKAPQVIRTTTKKPAKKGK